MRGAPSIGTGWLLAAALLTGQPGTAVAAQQTHGEVPCPDRCTAVLYLELVVNATPTGRIVRVDYIDGRYLVSTADLKAASLPVADTDTGTVATADLADVTTEYDGLGQRLLLTVPPAWLPAQRLTVRRPADGAAARTSFGVVVNYDAYATAASGTGDLSVWSEQRAFDRWGAVSTTGIYRHSLRGQADATRRYLRYDTGYTYSDERRLLTLTAGDHISPALPWTNPVRLGGVSFARDFRVRPDIVTYPIPQFSGQAAVPTVVDVFINGSQAMTAAVAPGPFTVEGLPAINGAGTATVITTDALGRQVSTSMSFYVANTLLRKGTVDFAAAAGAMRRDYGVRSFGYGAAAATGLLRVGVTDSLTVDGHVEARGGLAAASLGADVKLGTVGVVSGSWAQGHGWGASHRQYSLDYSYTGPRYSLVVRRLRRGGDYLDLAGAASPGSRLASSDSARSSDTATAGLNLGHRFGTLNAGYFHLRGGHRRAATAPLEADAAVTTLSYTRAFVRSSTLLLTATRSIGTERRMAGQLQVAVPLRGRGTVSAGTVQATGDERSHRVQYSRAPQPAGGWGWNVGAATGDDGPYQGDLTWRGRGAEVRAGTFGRQGYRTGWASASGSAIVMDGAVFPALRVSDAFVLVDTDGRGGVPVFFENQPVGRTNRRGHLMVPWVNSYYPATFTIDPLDLPIDAAVNTVEQRVAVRRASGAVLRFPIARISAATIALIDDDGQPLEAGLPVVHDETGQRTHVGWDGLVYVEGVTDQTTLRVELDATRSCRVRLRTRLPAGTIARFGPVTCR